MGTARGNPADSGATDLLPGQRVRHAELGVGVLVSLPVGGYVRAFFPAGERQVPVSALTPMRSDAEEVAFGVEGSASRLRAVWLALEARTLPLLDNAAALTAARIDLLPHQVVLTHCIATALPRRYLIADEVGLGKTIETALILRELASRGELKRALMVVPAGLVNNWHRELNEVFHLEFEVFGSEGDVTDRKTNAFARHDRLIASVDTLKRPGRMQRLREAPHWDLVVFDEAHHLTATKQGSRVQKTENFKLAELLRDRTRDLLLLSATPHQGDHFRFYMLVGLLDPTLFRNADDMVENRHRLANVIFRRTKADACRPDGSPLFARRVVQTHSFTMREEERTFYGRLREYLEDGFALARRKGNEGRALGFLMAIFQKIAASSFAAVRRTLRRRLLALTVQEALARDHLLDIEGREELYTAARTLIHEDYGLPVDPIGRGEVEKVLADIRVKILKKLRDEDLALIASVSAGEELAAEGEEEAAWSVAAGLPEERRRILDLLASSPAQREQKVEQLLIGLGALWRHNPNEKVVIFATYLGTVDLIGREIDAEFPGQGVVVLRGGDHGTKLAAERRFKTPSGPKVIVCTAAGREGINLQNARVLFNFDLPWNPMDIEQRIGRIHRYKQHHTAQVYNLVLSDTIEGRIFLLLEEKLNEIGRTLGKLDEEGNLAEDLRGQILGQLAERVNYDQLYQAALSDPELKRTRQELNAALENAREARKVVFELFQDLEGFSLDDYKPFADVTEGMDRLLRFLRADVATQNGAVVAVDDRVFEIHDDEGKATLRFTTDRDLAADREDMDLLGLDHPRMQAALKRWGALPFNQRGVAVCRDQDSPAIATWWAVQSQGSRQVHHIQVVPLAVSPEGQRLPALERLGEALFDRRPAAQGMPRAARATLLHEALEPMLQREIAHRGLVEEGGAFSAELVAWVEVSGVTPKVITLRMEVEYRELTVERLTAIQETLRRVAEDPGLRIVKVMRGSALAVLEVSNEAVSQRIVLATKTGDLQRFLGIEISDVIDGQVASLTQKASPERAAALYKLLLLLFPVNDLRRWLKYEVKDQGLVFEVSWQGSRADVAEAATDGLCERGLVNQRLFEGLLKERPGQRGEILRCAAVWGTPLLTPDGH